MIKIIYSAIPVIEWPAGAIPAQNLNGTGWDFDEYHDHPNHHENYLIVVTDEEDNRNIKGGMWSLFGFAYPVSASTIHNIEDGSIHVLLPEVEYECLYGDVARNAEKSAYCAPCVYAFVGNTLHISQIQDGAGLPNEKDCILNIQFKHKENLVTNGTLKMAAELKEIARQHFDYQDEKALTKSFTNPYHTLGRIVSGASTSTKFKWVEPLVCNLGGFHVKASEFWSYYVKGCCGVFLAKKPAEYENN